MSDERTTAEKACLYLMGRVFRDRQLAYLIGPGTEAYRKLTDAIAYIEGKEPDAYRAEIIQHIVTEPVVAKWQYEELQATIVTS